MEENKRDAYAFNRVPINERVSLFNVTIVRMGMATSLAQFMLGTTLGHGMTFFQAMLATTLGSIILVFVSFGLGYAGMREGLSTSVLSRWCGFGKSGSMLIGLAISISLLGWFGVNIALIAQSLLTVLGSHINYFWCSVISGLVFSLLVAFGFNALSITAKIAVPLFLAVIFYMCYHEIVKHTGESLYSSSPLGEGISIGEGATMVAGLFIVGALITPDTSRYCKNGKHVFWMITSSVIIGEFFINGIVILVAHALGTSNVVEIMIHTAGWIGVLTVILSAIKVNDTNLYSASINIIGFLEMLTGKRFNYTAITLLIGLLGTLLSLSGVLEAFIPFLMALGLIFPPIAGVMLVDYYILRTSRHHLERSRKLGKLPNDVSMPITHLVAIISCALGSTVGVYLKYGIPSVNSIFAAGIGYWLLMNIKSALRK
ncbi:cytosine permease [Sodalis sp. TME1]|nr:cytosine permease [Sodalis sp. TME1]